MPTAWQSFPLSIDPVALMIGSFPLTWYAILYSIGAFVAAVYFVRLARQAGLLADADATVEVIVSVLWGVLIGARLGYIVLYGGPEFISEPWRIILPYDFDRDLWVGIRGMSFHGGLVGGALGLFMFTRERSRGFLAYSDCLVQAVPLAILFGRIGNFLNLEIFGRPTNVSWGMYFPGSGSLLHPVVLYEAVIEGVILFLVLAALKSLQMAPGRMTIAFLFLYAGMRYWMESFRAIPQVLVFGIFTTGQALSVALVLLGAVMLLVTRKRVVY